jgi:N-methylhydantoinase A/oxoprolinase/acetone carboxylase beta subunit
MVLGHGTGEPHRPSVFEIRFDDALPLVAVGAPAESWYPAVAKTLRTALAVPRHGDVANAVGAVLGEVAQRVHLTVTQPVQGVFRVFAHNGPRDFPTLDAAYDCAREVAGAEALVLARNAGAHEPVLRTEVHENSAEDDAGNRVFFEARVTATASGPPALAH